MMIDSSQRAGIFVGNHKEKAIYGYWNMAVQSIKIRWFPLSNFENLLKMILDQGDQFENYY